MTSSDEVCAVMASNLSDHGRHHSLRQLSDAWEDNYECNYRVARQKWYQDKLRRSVKEMNEVVVGVVSEIRQEICKRRVGIKVVRFTLGLPSMILFRERVDAVNYEFMWINQSPEIWSYIHD
ncbi:hypothetical protein IMY05_007G0114000 [Salix suchowensis]|nr:hypothetical protein IMY05_007G0114000 [Salix suchowensis]